MRTRSGPRKSAPGADVQAVASVAVAVVGTAGVHADAPPGAARLRLAFVHVHAIAVLRMRPVAGIAMAGIVRGSRDALSVATDVLVQSALVRLCDLSRAISTALRDGGKSGRNWGGGGQEISSG